MCVCFTRLTFFHVSHSRKGDVLAPTNTKNAEFGGPGQRTQGRADVCFRAFHVYHRRKGDSEAPKTQKHANTRLQVIIASVYGFSDHRSAYQVEKVLR